MNALAPFQRMMNELLGHLSYVKVYLDDVVMFSKYLNEHIGHIEKVVHIVAASGLKLKISKCDFVHDSVKLLGHNVCKSGVKVDSDKIQVINETP